MKYNSKKLVFIGHFDIGERFTKQTQLLIKEGLKEKNSVFCTLVGDIGLQQKVKEYRENGINGIKQIYRTRIDCTKSECVLQQLPNTEKGLNSLIEPHHYQKILTHIETNNHNKNQLELIKETTFKIIEERINEYGLPKDKLVILTETRCRNRAFNRLKPRHQHSWHKINGFRVVANNSYIKDQMIANENRIPVCRGVMFAFFEYITLLGFEEIKFYLEKRHLKSISMGWLNYWSVQKSIPHLNSYIQKVKFILPQSLQR